MAGEEDGRGVDGPNTAPHRPRSSGGSPGRPSQVPVPGPQANGDHYQGTYDVTVYGSPRVEDENRRATDRGAGLETTVPPYHDGVGTWAGGGCKSCIR